MESTIHAGDDAVKAGIAGHAIIAEAQKFLAGLDPTSLSLAFQ